MLHSGRGWIKCRIGIELIRAKRMTVQRAMCGSLGLLGVGGLQDCRTGTTFGMDSEALARKCVSRTNMMNEICLV
jgi:hypothetical protein